MISASSETKGPVQIELRRLGPAAVCGDDLPGQITGCLTEAENDLRDLVRCAETVGRDFFFYGGKFIGREMAVHISVNDAAGYGVDADTARRKFLGKRSGKAVHTGLAGRIGSFHGGADIAPDR